MRLTVPGPSSVLSAMVSTGVYTAQELTSIAAHVLRYPAGVMAERHEIHDPRHRLDPLGPVSRGLLLSDIDAAGTPVVLVHGIVDNRAAFSMLRRTLRRRGYGRITTVNYSPLTSDIRVAARQLERHVERVCSQTGYEQVVVVGHSMGGVIARYYAQCLGGDRRASSVVTIGSPHAGTRTARLLPIGVARQLRPQSPVIAELSGRTQCRTRFVAIYSDRDEIVLPHRSASLEHPDLDVTRIPVHGVGHLALLTDRGVAHTVADVLVPDARLIRYERAATSLHRTESLGYGSATPLR